MAACCCRLIQPESIRRKKASGGGSGSIPRSLTQVRIDSRRTRAVSSVHGDVVYGNPLESGFGRVSAHYRVLDRDRRAGDDAALAFAATVRHVRSGRRLDVFTSEPGLQFYSGNVLDGTLHSAQGTYFRRTGLCLETQKFPDSPNHPAFPPAVVRPGQRYSARTRFVFSHD
jgi:galactose mutarotase-like enzyme